MRTTTILIALGLGISAPAFAQENFFEIPAISLTRTNVNKEPVGILAEMPTLTIKPGDVIQASIECLPDTTQEDINRNGWQHQIPLPLNYPTNAFRVRWTYTAEAAKQVSAFRDQHRGETVRTAIGSFSMACEPGLPAQLSKLFGSEEMKSRWLAKPVDGRWGLTEEQARQMVVDLKSK